MVNNTRKKDKADKSDELFNRPVISGSGEHVTKDIDPEVQKSGDHINNKIKGLFDLKK